MQGPCSELYPGERWLAGMHVVACTTCRSLPGQPLWLLSGSLLIEHRASPVLDQENGPLMAACEAVRLMEAAIVRREGK